MGVKKETTKRKTRAGKAKPQGGRMKQVGKDKLEEKAFEIYQIRMSKNLPGDELSDWLEAEKQMK